jgi:protein tyrosine/serine phosphatase
MSSSELLTELFAHVLESCRREVATVVELIATSPAPILVHCSGGKDRTALIVVLVLDALGADTSALLADHLLSNEGVPALERRLGRAMGRPLDAPLSRVDEASIRSALETWRAHPGGAEGWLLESGLSRENLDALRGRLVER